jgi:hypothetical protein
MYGSGFRRGLRRVSGRRPGGCSGLGREDLVGGQRHMRRTVDGDAGEVRLCEQSADGDRVGRSAHLNAYRGGIRWVDRHLVHRDVGGVSICTAGGRMSQKTTRSRTTMSRTPFKAIAGFADALENTRVAGQTREVNGRARRPRFGEPYI